MRTQEQKNAIARMRHWHTVGTRSYPAGYNSADDLEVMFNIIDNEQQVFESNQSSELAQARLQISALREALKYYTNPDSYCFESGVDEEVAVKALSTTPAIADYVERSVADKLANELKGLLESGHIDVSDKWMQAIDEALAAYQSTKPK